MPFLQRIPSELLENVIFHIETPKDLLNVALTCKYLRDLVVPTYHLHLANISCSVAETSSTFWQKLSTSPRFCSMIRHIELCDDYLLSQDSPIRQLSIRQLPIVLMDKKFVTKWATGSKYQRPRTDRSNFENFFDCLGGLINCQSITLLEPFSDDEFKDIFTYITVNLSKNLRTLVIKSFGRRRANKKEYVPRYLFSPEMTCSFDRLTTFHIDLDMYESDYLIIPINRMLDLLVSSCSTLINFVLMLSWWEPALIRSRLLRSGNWPSLKKLKLRGLDLFGGAGNTRDIYISFFERHSQIECLLLEGLNGNVLDDDFEAIFQSPLPPHVLPHLRSLHSDSPLHSDILPRLYHISFLHIFDPSTYSLARSLRSCTLTASGSTGVINRVVAAFPQLERLWVCLSLCLSNCEPDPCDCILLYNPEAISGLPNLTHLGIFAKNTEGEMMVGLLESLVTRLPLLSYIYLYNDRPEQYQVIRKADTGSFSLKRSKQLYQHPDGIDLADIFHTLIKDMPI